MITVVFHAALMVLFIHLGKADPSAMNVLGALVNAYFMGIASVMAFIQHMIERQKQDE